MKCLHTKQRREWIQFETRTHQARIRRAMLGALLLAVLIVGWCEW